MSKDNFVKLNGVIDVKHLSTEVQNLWRVLQAFFDVNDGVLTVDDLANLFFATQPKDTVFYQEVFSNLRTIEAGELSVLELARSLKRAYTLRKLAETAYEASEGKKELVEAVKGLYDDLQSVEETSDTAEEEFYTTDLETLIAMQNKEPGYNWRLPSMRRALGPIRRSNLGIIFARPESGKSAFVLSETSHFVEQLDGHCLFLSNEEAGDAMMMRFYQATLNATREQILGNVAKAKAAFTSKIKDRLLFKDSAVLTYKDVERLCRQYQPKLIVVDQLDKIKGFQNDQEHLKLGALYQFFREVAKEYGPVIGVTQANGLGENVKWLEMTHMAGSTTAKQAEADWILGIGKIHDPGYDNVRFMHLCKNKLPGGAESVPSMRHGRWETIIDPMNVRYKDIQ